MHLLSACLHPGRHAAQPRLPRPRATPRPAPAVAVSAHLVPRTPQALSLTPITRAGARAQCAATGQRQRDELHRDARRRCRGRARCREADPHPWCWHDLAACASVEWRGRVVSSDRRRGGAGAAKADAASEGGGVGAGGRGSAREVRGDGDAVHYGDLATGATCSEAAVARPPRCPVGRAARRGARTRGAR